MNEESDYAYFATHIPLHLTTMVRVAAALVAAVGIGTLAFRAMAQGPRAHRPRFSA
jgi:hypothetical protein